jgi:hypothetical protein
MSYNECILLTIKIKDDLQKTINNIRKREFTKTGNPSFKFFNNSLVLGLYNGNKLPSYIELPNRSIIINKKVNLQDGILYYTLNNSFSLLSEKIINKKDFTFPNNKYFPLANIINKELTPFIYLGNNANSNPCSYNLNKSYILDDFKIELVKIRLEESSITYSIVDYRHLKNNTI